MDEQRLIDANKLRQDMDSANEYATLCSWQILEDIDRQPTVDAKPVVHGHWIDHGTDEAVCSFSECSVCGTYIHMCHKFCEYESENYCPHCGSRMDEPVVISYTWKDGERDE